jgi:hypothetical protein
MAIAFLLYTEIRENTLLTSGNRSSGFPWWHYCNVPMVTLTFLRYDLDPTAEHGSARGSRCSHRKIAVPLLSVRSGKQAVAFGKSFIRFLLVTPGISGSRERLSFHVMIRTIQLNIARGIGCNGNLYFTIGKSCNFMSHLWILQIFYGHT